MRSCLVLGHEAGELLNSINANAYYHSLDNILLTLIAGGVRAFYTGCRDGVELAATSHLLRHQKCTVPQNSYSLTYVDTSPFSHASKLPDFSIALKRNQQATLCPYGKALAQADGVLIIHQSRLDAIYELRHKCLLLSQPDLLLSPAALQNMIVSWQARLMAHTG